MCTTVTATQASGSQRLGVGLGAIGGQSLAAAAPSCL
jgi:hypothetical protein